jgi:hypothetical protein
MWVYSIKELFRLVAILGDGGVVKGVHALVHRRLLGIRKIERDAY